MLAWDQNGVYITIGPKGIHSVCVCTAHQNSKLLLSSVNLSKNYHQLLELITCDRNSRVRDTLLWVLPRCQCSEKNLLKGNLWKMMMMVRLMTMMMTAVDHQWQGWTDLLHTWWIHWTVVWEIRWNNFSFFHCKITISVSKQTKIEPEMWWSNYPWRFCRKDTIKYICDSITEALFKVHYFSDVFAGQHKNCKNFLDLCLHNIDVGVKCELNFFAISHGKSPYDGIGGTVKWLVTRAGLQEPISNQILTADKMLDIR